MNPQGREDLVLKTIAAGVIPGQIARYIESSNKISQAIINIENDSEYLNKVNYGQGYYASDPDKNINRMNNRQRQLKVRMLEEKKEDLKLEEAKAEEEQKRIEKEAKLYILDMIEFQD